MKMVEKSTMIACILAGFAGFAFAQSAADDALSTQVDKVLRAQMREQMIPGVSLAVIRDGKIIKATGYGLANIELDVPVTPPSIFQSGSIGKQFTATAILMLVEEGKVGLDDSITKYFPEAPASWKPVTIRHMLTHTSGLPDIFGETEADAYGKGILDFRRDYTEEEFVRKFVTLPLDFQPGEKWNYSNTGYMLLGVMIHRLTGYYWGDFMQQRIFQPLGMTSTRVMSETDIVPNRSSGYRIIDGQIKNQEWVAPSLNTTADGGLYTNVLDLAKWDAALYTEKLLKKSTVEQMWTPVKLNPGKTYPDPYGFGWQINNANGHRVVWHTGGNQGFFVIISRYLDDRLTIVAMTNLDEFHCDVVKMAGAIASIYIPETAGANPVKDW
jgi:CubicO group peptidase (beta-lactamase class C family)